MHVLVVDDYDDMAETLAALIVQASPMAITTDVGLDGSQALLLAAAHLPQVAILDIDMPIMNGVDAAIAMRIKLGVNTPLLIAMTGRPDHAASVRTHLAFDVVMTKPIELDTLLDCLTCDARSHEPARSSSMPLD